VGGWEICLRIFDHQLTDQPNRKRKYRHVYLILIIMTTLAGMPEDEDGGGRRRLIEGELPGLHQHTDLLLRLLDDFVGAGSGNAEAINSHAARGVLFEGPSGSGKTALAKAVGKYGGLPSHYLSCPSLFGTDRGDAERGVLGAFQACADKAATSDRGACVLILDEVESIGKVRFFVSKREE
jgi:hypothetical protein